MTSLEISNKIKWQQINWVNTVPEVSVERRQWDNQGTRTGVLVPAQLEDTEIGHIVMEVSTNGRH